MNVWAIADLHLSFGVPDKTMAVFGPHWVGYAEKIETQWRRLVRDEDLVLIAGDISWAMKSEEAKVDLDWIGALPGIKAMIRGNHDYWWGSLAKMRKILPPSLHAIQNDVFNYHEISIAGARLWDSDEYDFNPYIDFREKKVKREVEESHERQKIFDRELVRLELSLKALRRDACVRIAMTHYPPIGADLHPSQTSALLEKYGVEICLFGHLHNVKQGALPFGSARGVHYFLTSCDYLDFSPLKVYSSAKCSF